MLTQEARTITEEVFQSWTSILAAQVSTPVMCLGVGHGWRSGQLQLCVRDDPAMTKAAIRAFLLKAIELLD